MLVTFAPCIEDPLFQSVRELLGRFDRLPSIDELNEKLTSSVNPPGEASLKFALDVRVRRGGPRAPYHQRILNEGLIPTREGSAHDFFNALIFAAFPRSKRVLHARAQAFLEQRTDHSKRGPIEDVLAQVDEGGVLVDAAAPSTFLVFGHAILEHHALGRGGEIRGKPLRVASLEASISSRQADARLADQIRAGSYDRRGNEAFCVRRGRVILYDAQLGVLAAPNS